MSNLIVNAAPDICEDPRAGGSRIGRWLGILALLLVLTAVSAAQGCSSKYTVEGTGYGGHAGEVNRHSRLIRATPERIYHILTHESLFKTLCPEGTIVTHETPPPYGPGTLIKTKVQHIFELEWHTRVEAVIPGKMIKLLFLDGFFAGGLEFWDLEEEGCVTRITQTIVVDPKGFGRRAAWVLKVRRKHDTMVERFLDNLKALAEQP